jgi:hypothetical protein
LLVGLLVVCAAAPSPAADYRFADDAASPSPWAYPEPAATPVAADGVRYLGVADRVDLTGKQPVWHRRLSYEVAEEHGLSSAGQFGIRYQPAFQRVVLHAIDVWRDGVRMDRRGQSRIEVLRREAGLENGLIDGGRELSVTIPDIRVGDRIEYRYTIEGYNPVFGRGYHDYWNTRYSVPLGARVIRVDYPVGMSLTLPSAPSGFVASTGVVDGGRWWELRGRDLAKVDEEDGTPDSFEEASQVEISTARDWRDVAQWATPLYPGRFSDRALAAELSKRLRLDPADPQGSLMRATAFVQGEVRYTGLDMGLQSHAPNRPELVVERRFGDCKDKTQLLIALLHEAGVAASPVLVNTRHRGTIADRMASPLAFDHVIVRAELPEGSVWVDPTRERERGPLAGRAPLDFGKGLVVGPGSDRLVEVPAPFPAIPEIDVDQRLDFSTKDDVFNADFLVETTYAPGHAEGIRRNFASQGAADIGKRYLGYMQNYYEGLRAPRDPVMVDDEQALKVSEAYTLEWSGKAEGSVFGIISFQLLDWAPSLPDQVRLTPLSLGGPRYGRQVVRSFHPDGWSIEAGEEVVENAYFHFRRQIEVHRNMLKITVEWKRLADQVPAADYAAVRGDLREARELLQYDIDLDAGWPMPSLEPRDWAWPALAWLMAMGLMAGLWWMRGRWLVAGMLYRPRTTVATRLATHGLAIGGVIGLIAVLVEAFFERGGALLGKPSAFAIGVLIGGFVVMLLRWYFLAALLQWTLRLFGHRVAYREMRHAYGLAQIPMAMFLVLAMVALGFRLHWLDQVGDPARAPAQIVALLLVATGMLWWLASLSGACAGVAGTRRRKGVLVVGISVFPLVCAGLALVFFVLPG